MPSRGTVATGATSGVPQPSFVERRDLDKLRQFDTLHKQLCDPVASVDHDRFGWVEVDQRNLDLATVARVDGAGAVHDGKPNAGSQSRPGMDKPDHALRDRDRNTRGDERALPRRQDDVVCAVQIDTRIAGVSTVG
jgi:hypothetical protein